MGFLTEDGIECFFYTRAGLFIEKRRGMQKQQGRLHLVLGFEGAKDMPS